MLHLQHILHVPELTKNLLSISKLTKDNHVFVEFHCDKYLGKDKVTKKILLEGKVENGLYNLKLPTQLNNGQPCHGKSYATKHLCFLSNFKSVQQSSIDVRPVCFNSKLESVQGVWHKRLGHPSHRVLCQALKSYVSNLNISEKSFFCDACELGKSHALPFAPSTSHTTKPLELVHTDL